MTLSKKTSHPDDPQVFPQIGMTNYLEKGTLRGPLFVCVLVSGFVTILAVQAWGSPDEGW